MEKRVETERMRISQTGIYSKEGFTLIELVVVIFIVSLFLAISIPFFKVESGMVRSEAKRIASILRYLNDTATARKVELYLTIDFKDRSISYTAEDGEKTIGIEYVGSVFVETKGKINDGSVKIVFTPLGVGELIRFYLFGTSSSQDPVIRVELNPLSGRVKIDENKE